MEFKWDDEKAFVNMQKHGIDFEVAARVFLDPNQLEKDNLGHNRSSGIADCDGRLYRHEFGIVARTDELRSTTGQKQFRQTFKNAKRLQAPRH